FDRDLFEIAQPEKHVATEVRIDDGLERELDLTHAQARAVFLRRAVGREIADEIADGADIGEEAWIGRSYALSGCLRRRGSWLRQRLLHLALKGNRVLPRLRNRISRRLSAKGVLLLRVGGGREHGTDQRRLQYPIHVVFFSRVGSETWL